MIVIGWDVSTSAIGVCVRDLDGTTREFFTIFPKGATHLEKHRFAVDAVVKFVTKYDGPMVHVVEERLGGFTGGLTTKQTLMALAAMNAVVSLALSSSGKVVHLAPVTTKKLTGLKVEKGADKKLAVIGLVRSKEPSFPYAETASGNYVKGVDDMADAWLLAEAWMRVERGEASLGQPRKDSSRKRKARAPAGVPSR